MDQAKLPLISVIMPVFNREKYLAEAIESVLNQTYDCFEFIIIDDGSTDGSWKIIDAYSKKDNRIKAFKNEFNKRISNTRNFGLDKSEGKYIAVMDSDDISLPDRFEKQVTYLETHPEIDVLGTQIELFGQTQYAGKVSDYPLTPGGVSWGLVFDSQLAHPSVMMRSEIFTKDNLKYREYEAAQDYELWARLSPNHQLANLPHALLKYRVHNESISNTKRKIQKEEAIRIIDNYVKELTGANLSENLIRGLTIT